MVGSTHMYTTTLACEPRNVSLQVGGSRHSTTIEGAYNMRTYNKNIL